MNIFDLPQITSPVELTDIFVECESIRVERILSTGQVSSWYDQVETEFVVLLEGSAEIEYEHNSIISLKKGDTLLIEPHKKHRVSYTSSVPPCVWLCVSWG